MNNETREVRGSTANLRGESTIERGQTFYTCIKNTNKMAICKINTFIVFGIQWELKAIQRMQDWRLKKNKVLSSFHASLTSEGTYKEIQRRLNTSLAEALYTSGSMNSNLKNLWHMLLMAARPGQFHGFLHGLPLLDIDPKDAPSYPRTLSQLHSLGLSS